MRSQASLDIEQAGSAPLRRDGARWSWLGSHRPLPGWLVYLRTIAAFLLVWHLAALWIDRAILLPSPLAVGSALLDLARDGELLDNTLVSLRRLGIAFAVAAVVGIPLGFLMGLSRLADALVDPVIELLRPISGIAWIPLGLFILGIGDELPIFIMSYAALFPFVLNTFAGVRSTDRRLVEAARTLGVAMPVIIRQVVLPAALPNILVGTRLAAGSAWMAMIAAELIGSPSGLGFAIEWYRELLMTSKTLAYVVVVGVLGYLVDRALRALQASLTPWAAGRGAW